jgi:hypothetical protein
MVSRDWHRETRENLQDFERRQASLWHNPSLARLYIERGVGVALVVVLTYCATGIKGIDQQGRTLFLTCSIFGAMIAATLIATGICGLVHQRARQSAADANGPADGPPAIGW